VRDFIDVSEHGDIIGVLHAEVKGCRVDAASPTGFQNLDEVLEEQESGLARGHRRCF